MASKNDRIVKMKIIRAGTPSLFSPSCMSYLKAYVLLHDFRMLASDVSLEMMNLLVALHTAN